MGIAIVLATKTDALAADVLRIAVNQRGIWESSVSHIGQAAGIFKKHGIELDLVYTKGGGESLPVVISGGVEVAIAVGTMGVLRAYAQGAPVRIIGSTATGDNMYWYSAANSPIKSPKDADGKTISYSSNGSSSHHFVLELIKHYNMKAKPVPSGSVAATFTQVMLGQIDVGWAAPPFGIDAIDSGKIRVIARTDELPNIQNQTVRVLVSNLRTVRSRKDTLVRFMRAYKETIEFMYKEPSALQVYGKFANVTEALARRMKDEFFPKDMLWPDKIGGIDEAMATAVRLNYLRAPLSKEQVAELIQIPAQ